MTFITSLFQLSYEEQPMKYAVGDVESTAKGSGARANSGKVSLTQVPIHLFAGVARVLMGGMLKYAAFNWAKGMKWSVPMDCALRHLNKWWFMGEEIDYESGEHHLDHAITNLLMLRHYVVTHKDGDDRPPLYAGFADFLEEFNRPFDKEAYLERNPEVRAKIEEKQ